MILIGDEAVNGNESSWSMDCSTVVRVKTLHISSPILAAKSPFFYKVWFSFCSEVILIVSFSIITSSCYLSHEIFIYISLFIFCSSSQMG